MATRGRISEALKNTIKTAYSKGTSVEDLAKELNRPQQTIKIILGLAEAPVKASNNQKLVNFKLADGRNWSFSLPLNMNEEDVSTMVDAISNAYEEMHPSVSAPSLADKLQQAIAEDQADVGEDDENEEEYLEEEEDELISKYYEMQNKG